MDQQQLQIARAALWHQTAGPASSALQTFDAAAEWLDDIGFCLFLPRHTQLPVPAPSFVEACLGAPSITPAPPAIAQATELLARLVAERRVVPLNLLGAFSEQPDFLVSLEVLPWVAAVRGDRQWKIAPAGRTAPIVLRTFEALDREGELTAIQLREILGREITEAAALRALMELWTGLRAMPIAAPGEPTRWTLLKNRFPAQLATGANASHITALSALLSLYLRSAVAATAEEAEIFLSPLTARSRIREVLHGMMATRQIASTTVATHNVLFVEGSLPETPPPAEPEAAPQPALPVAAKTPARKRPRPTRWELPPRESRSQPDQSPPWQKKPPAAHRPQPGSERPRRDERRPAGPRPVFGRGFNPRSAGNGPRQSDAPRQAGPRPGGPRPPGDKPWQRRKDAFPPRPFRDRQVPPESPAASSDRPAQGDRPAGKAPWRGRPDRPAPFGKKRQPGGDRPWRERPAGPPFRKTGAPPRGRSQERPPFRKDGEQRRDQTKVRPPFRKDREPSRDRSERRPPFRKTGGPSSNRAAGRPPFRKAGEQRPDRPQRPPQFRGDRSNQSQNRGPGQGKRPWSGRPALGAKRPTSAEGAGKPSAAPGRPFRPGKPFAGKSFSGKPGRSGPPKNKFRKSFPGKQKPRKNRSQNQEETPE